MRNKAIVFTLDSFSLCNCYFFLNSSIITFYLCKASTPKCLYFNVCYICSKPSFQDHPTATRCSVQFRWGHCTLSSVPDPSGLESTSRRASLLVKVELRVRLCRGFTGASSFNLMFSFLTRIVLSMFSSLCLETTASNTSSFGGKVPLSNRYLAR